MKIVEMKGVSYRYPTMAEATIENLSFAIEDTGIYSIIGVSGCGKSTIFRLLNGFHQPDQGTILIKGHPMEKKHHGEVLCGYMPQRDLLLPWRTIEENVALPIEIGGQVSKKEKEEKVQEALETVGLGDYLKKKPKELSGGMRQRAAFARTMVTGADIWLLDEPFSALDFLTRISMQEWLLAMLDKRDKTVLFITHDVEEAVFLSRKVFAVERAPISHLREFEVPEAYPRRRECLGKAEMIALKEGLIDGLRKQVVL